MKKKEGFISIIIPVYNAQNVIEECLQSILKQDYKQFEILCVDDGSTDETISIVQKQAKKDPRIHLIRKEHGGQGTTRNYGISEAKGEFILFIDSDDVIDEKMLGSLIKRAEETEADVVISGIHLEMNKKFVCDYVVDDFSGSCQQFMEEKFKESYQKWLINAPWNKLIKTEFLMKYNLRFAEKMRIYEDLLFSLEVIQHAKIISIVGQPYYTYRYLQPGSVLSGFAENEDQYIYTIGNKLEEMSLEYEMKMPYYYADLIHKVIVYASKIRRNKSFSWLKKIKKICVLFSDSKWDKYLELARAEERTLKRQIFWIRKTRWIMKFIAASF